MVWNSSGCFALSKARCLLPGGVGSSVAGRGSSGGLACLISTQSLGPGSETSGPRSRVLGMVRLTRVDANGVGVW